MSGSILGRYSKPPALRRAPATSPQRQRAGRGGRFAPATVRPGYTAGRRSTARPGRAQHGRIAYRHSTWLNKGKFDPEGFKYDSENDCLICPARERFNAPAAVRPCES